MQQQLDKPLAIEVSQALNRAAHEIERLMWRLEDTYSPADAFGMFPGIQRMYWNLRREAAEYYPPQPEVAS